MPSPSREDGKLRHVAARQRHWCGKTMQKVKDERANEGSDAVTRWLVVSIYRGGQGTCCSRTIYPINQYLGLV